MLGDYQLVIFTERVILLFTPFEEFRKSKFEKTSICWSHIPNSHSLEYVNGVESEKIHFTYEIIVIKFIFITHFSCFSRN